MKTQKSQLVSRLILNGRRYSSGIPMNNFFLFVGNDSRRINFFYSSGTIPDELKILYSSGTIQTNKIMFFGILFNSCFSLVNGLEIFILIKKSFLKT